MLAQGQDDKNLRSLTFAPRFYCNGIEAAKFVNGSFVTWHTDDSYNSFVQDVEYTSDYSSVLTYYMNPTDADVQGYSFNLIINLVTSDSPRGRGTQPVDYSSLFDIGYDKIAISEGKICLPVKLSRENKEKIKYNPNHQYLLFALKADRATSGADEENKSVVSDFAVIEFSTQEAQPLDVSFKGISWWDEDGDYSIDLATHVFQVSEDKLDNIKDSVIVDGNDGHPVAIHKVSTDANGITKCCLSVEDSPEKIYGYTLSQCKNSAKYDRY